jgi:hypothetical protein
MSEVPVYNVSMMLLQRLHPERPPFRVVELAIGRPAAGQETSIPGVTPLRRVTDRSGA